MSQLDTSLIVGSSLLSLLLCLKKKKVFIYGSTGSLLQQARFSLVEVHGLSCPAACGVLVPQPGIKTASPALEVEFLTTGPGGKSLH